MAWRSLQDSLMAQRVEWDARMAQKMKEQCRLENADFQFAENHLGVKVVRVHSGQSPPSTTLALAGVVASGSGTSGDIHQPRKILLERSVAKESSIIRDPATEIAPSLVDQNGKCSCCFGWSATMFELTCTHTFCFSCMAQLFKNATKDNSLMPVRCCSRDINPKLVDRVLPPQAAASFKASLAEFLAVNKMYCTNTTCGTCIDLDGYVQGHVLGTNKFTCKKCTTNLCISCKCAWHSEFSCRQYQSLPDEYKNEGDTVTLKIAAKDGWLKCKLCGNLISLTVGWYHITCRCKHELCYLCRVKWKQCRCTHRNA